MYSRWHKTNSLLNLDIQLFVLVIKWSEPIHVIKMDNQNLFKLVNIYIYHGSIREQREVCTISRLT